MSTRIQSQIAKSNEEALAAFVPEKAEIDTMLTRLQALSDDHFGYAPTRSPGAMSAPWALRRAAQADHRQAFNEGEHAE